MVDTALYFSFTALYIALLGWGLFLYRNRIHQSFAYFLLVVTLGLIYDNGLLATGIFIGEGSTLETLNLWRFLGHAFFTPTLVLFALGIGRHSELQWAKKSVTLYSFLLITIALILYELTEITHQTLQPVVEYGVLRYTLVGGSSGPPIMVLIVTFILLLVSISLFRHTKWSVMMLGVILMILGSAIPLPIESGAITNTFELIFMTALLMTMSKFLPKEAG